MKKLAHTNINGNEQPSPDTKTAQGHRKTPDFPIVGIGASAGGLEALELFMQNVPQGCGIAFVIVQHLDPTHQGMLAELLQRVTRLTVSQAKDRVRIKPDCVYIIPPNKDMSILHGALHLFEPAEPRGLRLPIDFFFHSLAEDRQERSIGLILSGMGSDGTMGMRAIKDRGGLVLAQDPASAKYDSMPKSVILAGLADLVAPAEELAGKILDFLRRPKTITKSDVILEEKDQSALEKIFILLRTKTGHDFSLYKKNTVYRRIERRMNIHQMDKTSSYVRFLQTNPQEIELLFREMLIGVTSFFRDPESWDQLRSEVIPMLLSNLPPEGCLRAWSTGCSTGEEAYSLAIIFKEALEKDKTIGSVTLQIFATDLDQDSIDRARQGVYPAGITANVSPERLKRFFIKEGTGYRVGKEIRDMVTFATQNIIMDPPFTKLDLLICRNLLIYLTPELQKMLIPLFRYSLKPGGVLFLGSAESVGTFTELFTPLNVKARLFQRRESGLAEMPLAFPPSFVPAVSGITKELHMLKPEPNIQTLADQLLLQHFSPPSVLTNDKGDILYISGRTGKYLEPAAGKANWNIFAMTREGLRFELGSAFQQAVRQKDAIIAKGLTIEANGDKKYVDITVKSIEEPEALRGMVMIVFNDVAAPEENKIPRRSKNSPGHDSRSLELEQELVQLRKQLHTNREEMQSSQEELKSTNEELQSANEELQSTNEEMTTSKEEMQSLNEELQTVNAEQQSKMDELTRVHNDMRNLLNSTEIVTVFLDKELQIQRFTTGADKLFKLIKGDVGRPLSDITNNLNYPGLTEEAEEVLRTLVFSEKQISSLDGRWFSVRIMPYRTMEDAIVGVVITFINITATKILEMDLREEIARLKGLLNEKA